MKKNIKELLPKELEELYDMVGDEIVQLCETIERKTGYSVEGLFSLFGDNLSKTLEIDLDIAMLERPHKYSEIKVRHYMMHNPNNVLDKPIFAYQYNSWYMIYDGVHRTEANRRLGKKTIKANIIVPTEDTIKDKE
jgi:hypothetical protein